MRRRFKPGERIEVDYSDGIEILGPVTGRIQKTCLFIGSLCFYRYTFAEFTLSQKSEDFLMSHRRMFEFFNGVPQIISPDNLKSTVTKAHRYEPDLNQAYTRLAAHYACGMFQLFHARQKIKPLWNAIFKPFKGGFFIRLGEELLPA